MQIYSSIQTSFSPCVIALGCFDGVHLGHAAVIGAAKEIADSEKLPLAVWSFQEPPKNFFVPNSVLLLTDKNEKADAMRALGVDTLFSIPFDRNVAESSPEDFVRVLIEQLGARHLVCGFNFTFGKGGTGNAETLSKLCRELSVGVTLVPAYLDEGDAVSSSRIRKALEDGDVERAARWLGHPYSLSAPVVEGQRLGRTLGFPTINQCFAPNQAVPRHGVYTVRASVDGKTYFGIANVGTRPTVGSTLLCCETNLFDFSGDLYGKTVRVEFLSFLRSEKRFESLDALTAQVQQDIQRAKETFKKPQA